MKKLLILLSAIGISTTAAHAEITLSGSADAAYLSTSGSTAAGDSEIAVGSKASFNMSTATATGMTISTSISIEQDYDGADNHQVDDGQAVTFGLPGATIVVGDVEISDTIGSVGGVVGGVLDDASDLESSVSHGFLDDDGLGVELTTAVGAASLNISYVANDGADNFGIMNSSAAGADAAMSASISLPMGAYSVTLGVADSDSGESSSGASVSAAIGGGSLTVGYSQQTLIAANNTALGVNGDTEVVGAEYSMSLDADTSVAVGWNNRKDADSESSTMTELSISRALGGGASVYLDLQNLAGDTAANADGTAIAFGTSVSF